MLNIARLFGKSPFAPLQSHIDKVANCIEKLSEITNKIPDISPDEIEHLVKELSKLEHEADISKNDIRNHLPRSLLLQIHKSNFLNILASQDRIADKSEEIGFYLTLCPITSNAGFINGLKELASKSFETFNSAKQIIKEMDTLLESSFGGLEAEKVKTMVEKTSFLEYEAYRLKISLMKVLFSKIEPLTIPSFHQALKLVKGFGELAHLSENLANNIRVLLEIK